MLHGWYGACEQERPRAMAQQHLHWEWQTQGPLQVQQRRLPSQALRVQHWHRHRAGQTQAENAEGCSVAGSKVGLLSHDHVHDWVEQQYTAGAALHGHPQGPFCLLGTTRMPLKRNRGTDDSLR